MPWILTNEINAYDQQGEYFQAVWESKPTIGVLAKVLARLECHTRTTPEGNYKAHKEHYDKLAAWVHEKGGRQKNEETWYHLRHEDFEKAE
jgi:hypothetical protein